MKIRDFESRFEESLKLNKLQYSVEVVHEPNPALSQSWTWKKFNIQPRCPEFDAPLLVTLAKYNRSAGAFRRAKTSLSCFVVEPQTYFSGARKRPGVKRGLRNVWQYIRLHCLPL